MPKRQPQARVVAPKSKFQIAVQATPALAQAYRSGLQALGGNSDKIKYDDSRRLTGSVDVDKALLKFDKKKYGSEERWDYAIGFQPKQNAEVVHWVEVHPASGAKNVDDLLKKLTRLKTWLKANGQSFERFPQHFHWVATSGVHIPPHTPAARKLMSSGLRMPTPKLDLSRVS